MHIRYPRLDESGLTRVEYLEYLPRASDVRWNRPSDRYSGTDLSGIAAAPHRECAAVSSGEFATGSPHSGPRAPPPTLQPQRRGRVANLRANVRGRREQKRTHEAPIVFVPAHFHL